MSQQDTSEDEACLVQSLELARQRGLLSLELRVGISLARFWAGRAQPRAESVRADYGNHLDSSVLFSPFLHRQ